MEFKDAAVQTDIQTDCDSSQVKSSAHSDGDGQLVDSGESEQEECTLCEEIMMKNLYR